MLILAPVFNDDSLFSSQIQVMGVYKTPTARELNCPSFTHVFCSADISFAICVPQIVSQQQMLV
jgi:hypothetical protein